MMAMQSGSTLPVPASVPIFSNFIVEHAHHRRDFRVREEIGDELWAFFPSLRDAVNYKQRLEACRDRLLERLER